MLSGSAIRPTDVITTAAGLTVEVTNPDAEGRLILADALWWARRDGATHLVDLATLTGAMRAGMGDMYAGVFANDDAWRDAVVDAGNASGDLAWPWPLHPRYRPLIDSTVADLRNTAGKTFGFPIVAATFLQQFAGEGPWAHVDMLGTALLDEDRGDAFGRGATGYGVRMLVELAARLSDRRASGAPAMISRQRRRTGRPERAARIRTKLAAAARPNCKPDERHDGRDGAEHGRRDATGEYPSRPEARAGDDVVRAQRHEQAVQTAHGPVDVLRRAGRHARTTRYRP